MRIFRWTFALLIIAVIALIAVPFFRSVTICRNVILGNDNQIFFTAKQISFRTSLQILSDGALGEISIEGSTLLAKFRSGKITGRLLFRAGRFVVENLSGDLMDGTVVGTIKTGLDKDITYDAELEIHNIELERAVEAFKMSDNLRFTGVVSGRIECSGRGQTLTALRGRIESSPSGGVLVIQNKEWLEKIASYAKQDVNVIVENFKNYRYNECVLRLGLDGPNILISAHLNGAGGKRDLVVTLHDFNP